jgi:hypothetical protein
MQALIINLNNMFCPSFQKLKVIAAGLPAIIVFCKIIPR